MFDQNFWIPILIFSGYAAVITLGQYVSMSSGILTVASSAMAGAGGYIAGLISIHTGLPLVFALLAGAGAGVVLGAMLGFLTVRLAPLVAGLMTLAFAEVMVVLSLNSGFLGGANGLVGIPLKTTLRLVLIILVIMVFLVWRYDSSRLGFAARACRDDSEAASAVGVNVAWVKTLSFALGCGICGLGGAIAVHWTLVQTPSDLGFFFGVNFLTYAVLGGSYTIWGALAGGVGLTLLPELLRFSQNDRYILYGVLLTAIVIWRPEGVVTRRPLGAPPSRQFSRIKAMRGSR